MPAPVLRRRVALALLVLALPLTGCGGNAEPAAGKSAAVSTAPAESPSPSVSASASASLRPAAPMPAAEPVRIRIPSAGVDTSPVLDLGLNADRTVEVPSVAKADRMGWYTKGVTPGETGPAVLIGHYDTERGPAVLHGVGGMAQGDVITVDRADGSTALFRVREIEQVSKKAFPTMKVYGDTKRPELRVITCGGALVDGHRPDNIIVYADLVA